MKLFVIVAFITISSAARLEKLELEKQLRAYLPPDRQNNGLRGNGVNGIVRPSSGIPGTAGVGLPVTGAIDFTKYLPPNATAAGTPPFAGSLNGFGPLVPDVPNDPEQVGNPSQLLANQPDAIPLGTNVFGTQLNAASSTQEIPQQAFDEETGYHY